MNQTEKDRDHEGGLESGWTVGGRPTFTQSELQGIGDFVSRLRKKSKPDSQEVPVVVPTGATTEKKTGCMCGGKGCRCCVLPFASVLSLPVGIYFLPRAIETVRIILNAIN